MSDILPVKCFRIGENGRRLLEWDTMLPKVPNRLARIPSEHIYVYTLIQLEAQTTGGLPLRTELPDEVAACRVVYICGIYQVGLATMTRKSIAKLFRNGRSQAVRLPREFRFEGGEVRIRKVAEGVLLEPLIADARVWFAELDRLGSEPFLKQGRSQPRTPRRKIFR